MNTPLVLGLTLLLLPVPLSFLIPASPQASPDPWRVRRARWALTGFALFVAMIELASRIPFLATANGRRRFALGTPSP